MTDATHATGCRCATTCCVRASCGVRNSCARAGVSNPLPAPGEAGRVRLQGEPNQGEGPPERAVRGPAGPRRRLRNRLATAQVRDQVRSVRLSVDELASVTTAARASGMTLAGFLAQAAVEASRDAESAEGRIVGDRELITEFFAVRRNLRQVGNNLNQIAKAINSGSEAPPQTDTVLVAVESAVRRIDAIVDMVLRS
ncbi:MobC family plasmid mobilization relaxosome protein [Streptomyces triticirhizae]|uniref:MobC family plasmid mobilization relaxosome protein n=1 Tax=Streptomyces triticirhizae TaxID=2483353 RepID=UPI00389B2521